MAALALEEYVDGLTADGTVSVWAGPLSGPPAFTCRADEQHYAASTMKLALVIAGFRRAEAGEVDLDAPVGVHDDFASQVGGGRFLMDRDEDSDPEVWRRIGKEVALRWLCYRAIVRSSNLATNLVLEEVGLDAVAATLSAAGSTRSVVSRGIEDTAARDAGLQNIVTAADLAGQLQALAAGELCSAQSTREVLDVLAAQQINDAIPAGLPAGTKVAHKSGWVEGISHDAGIVYPPDGAPYVLVVCTTTSLSEQAGLDLLARAAAASWTDRQQLVDVG